MLILANDDNFKSFKYKAKLLGNAAALPSPSAANGILWSATIVVPLKYLSNSWRSFEMPWIICKVELKLSRAKYCVLSVAGNENNINEDANANNIISTIKNTKLYVPVVTLSTEDNQKLSRLLSKGFKRSVYWTK